MTRPIAAKHAMTTAKQPSLHEVFSIMERIGGGFASALASAWFRADASNRARIENTWADYVVEFAELAALEAKAVQP